MTTPPPHPIDVSGLITAEYQYIAQTAAEAHADRARISSFYLIAVGSLVAALLGTQAFNGVQFTKLTTLLLCVLFSLLTFLGTSTVLQLGRLRVAWRDSMLAMNRIKELAIQHAPELNDVYLWKTGSLPKLDKKNSISFLQAIEVSAISGLMLGTAIFFFLLSFQQVASLWHLGVACICGVAMFFVELKLYKWCLN
jgi:hypothetical protein